MTDIIRQFGMGRGNSSSTNKKTSKGRSWKFKKRHAYKDYDKDGKVNRYDCQPLNKHAQDNTVFSEYPKVISYLEQTPTGEEKATKYIHIGEVEGHKKRNEFKEKVKGGFTLTGQEEKPWEPSESSNKARALALRQKTRELLLTPLGRQKLAKEREKTRLQGEGLLSTEITDDIRIGYRIPEHYSERRGGNILAESKEFIIGKQKELKQTPEERGESKITGHRQPLRTSRTKLGSTIAGTMIDPKLPTRPMDTKMGWFGDKQVRIDVPGNYEPPITYTEDKTPDKIHGKKTEGKRLRKGLKEKEEKWTKITTPEIPFL